VQLAQWFYAFLALLPLQVANKAVITPPFLNDKYEKQNRKITKE
jgi:hypothetical protein